MGLAGVSALDRGTYRGLRFTPVSLMPTLRSSRLDLFGGMSEA